MNDEIPPIDITLIDDKNLKIIASLINHEFGEQKQLILSLTEANKLEHGQVLTAIGKHETKINQLDKDVDRHKWILRGVFGVLMAMVSNIVGFWNR